ncbi:MAG: hypothetical protein KME14_03420 [Tildeniella torsiva UHER 1998/13D]|jgi:hypothetical protein|nr:hypothetical protein [Tildeniella torsiva UHER 1998/13D]
MKALLHLLGLVAVGLGLYVLGQILLGAIALDPYFWQGFTAGLAVPLLAMGLLKLLLLPMGRIGYLGWVTGGLGMLFVVLSDGALLTPLVLLPFALAISSIVIGYRLMAIARLSL